MKGKAGWAAAALLGLVLAAGVGVAARELSTQEVGLSAEPLTVGEDLAPATVRTEPERTDTTERTTPDSPSRAAPAPAPSAPLEEPEVESDNSGPGSDSSGSGRGRGRGRSGGSDDD